MILNATALPTSSMGVPPVFLVWQLPAMLSAQVPSSLSAQQPAHLNRINLNQAAVTQQVTQLLKQQQDKNDESEDEMPRIRRYVYTAPVSRNSNDRHTTADQPETPKKAKYVRLVRKRSDLALPKKIKIVRYKPKKKKSFNPNTSMYTAFILAQDEQERKNQQLQLLKHHKQQQQHDEDNAHDEDEEEEEDEEDIVKPDKYAVHQEGWKKRVGTKVANSLLRLRRNADKRTDKLIWQLLMPTGEEGEEEEVE